MEQLVEDFVLVHGSFKKLEVGDLICIRHSGLLNLILGKYREKRYKHIALYIGNGRVLETQFFRKVGYRNLSYYDGKYDVYRYNEPLIDFHKMRILFSLRSHIGLPCDRLDVFMRFVRAILHGKIPRSETHRYIGSKIIRDAFVFAGLSMPDGDVCPDALSGWSGFHQIE